MYAWLYVKPITREENCSSNRTKNTAAVADIVEEVTGMLVGRIGPPERDNPRDRNV